MTTPAKNSQSSAAKTIKLSLARQVVEVYEGPTRISSFDCVTGDKEHPTDQDVFKVLRKAHSYRVVPLSVVRTARSSVSDWFGSHGCVRLAQADAKALYAWASVGTTVQVS